MNAYRILYAETRDDGTAGPVESYVVSGFDDAIEAADEFRAVHRRPGQRPVLHVFQITQLDDSTEA